MPLVQELLHIPCYISPKYDTLNHPIEEYAHFLMAGIDPADYGIAHAIDEQGNAYVELAYSRDFAKCCGDDTGMQQDEVMVVHSYLQGTKKAVIERETDLLTPDELRTNRPAVEAAILEELRIWVKYQTFARHKRVGVQNIMSSKYVSKWKMIIDRRQQQEEAHSHARDHQRIPRLVCTLG